MGFPPTQFNSSRISYNDIKEMKPRNDVNAYLATGPLLHPCRGGSIFEIIVGDDVGRSQALEVSFNIEKVLPKEA